MIKTLVLVFISVSLCMTVISAAPAHSVDEHKLNEHMNESSTTTTTTSTTTTTPITTTSLLTSTTTTTTVITEDASTVVYKVASNDVEESGSSHSLSKEKTVANFAQYNGKLLVNQSAESMNGRIISQQSNSNSNNNVTAVATNGLSLTVILVLIAAVTMVVSGIILSALFVMRRRFSIWRLNGDSNEESKEIPATSADNQPTENNNKEMLETVNKEELTEVNEKDPELAKQVSTLSAAAAVAAPVDTPVNINCDNGHSNEAATDLCSNEKLSDQQQASPSSSSPLIEKATDEQLATGLEAPNELKEQVTSSSSLIVNVLNELSESVACKLASPNSPTPESSAESDNAETQPLNKED
jgi:hypothetical protein